jgi:hypothetical protein
VQYAGDSPKKSSPSGRKQAPRKGRKKLSGSIRKAGVNEKEKEGENEKEKEKENEIENYRYICLARTVARDIAAVSAFRNPLKPAEPKKTHGTPPG